jgi:hypothetical protein
MSSTPYSSSKIISWRTEFRKITRTSAIEDK